MAPSTSTDVSLDPAARRTLVQVAHWAIDHGLIDPHPPSVRPDQFPESLRIKRAVFVTLKLEGKLRGCIGTLDPINTLVEDTARNAHQAAFKDPRFSPLTKPEADRIKVHISLLTEAEPLDVNGEDDLLRQLRPGRDGLIRQAGSHRATFLPAVWENVPEPAQFVRQLKQKAGLDADAWPPDLRCLRYEAESIS